jgi:1-acyl-sn-glycerol-3-phosphate acyltransferase
MGARRRSGSGVGAQRPADLELFAPVRSAQRYKTFTLGRVQRLRVEAQRGGGSAKPDIDFTRGAGNGYGRVRFAGHGGRIIIRRLHSPSFRSFVLMSADSDFAMPVDVETRRQDAYYWRFLVTGVSFFLFGLGALVVGAILLPLVRVMPAGRQRKRARARDVIKGALRLFITIMHRFGGLTYEFRGVERLGQPGQLIVANHPSLIDVVFLLAFTKRTGCVVKQGLWRSPLTRAAVTLAEYIKNDPTATMIEAASDALRSAQTLIMFPEGTRTTPGVPPVFHRGAANVALRAAASVTPVYIRVRPTTLTKAEPWYLIPRRRPHFMLIVGQDVDLGPYRCMPLPLASRALNEHLHAHFQAELSRLT